MDDNFFPGGNRSPDAGIFGNGKKEIEKGQPFVPAGSYSSE